MSNLTAATGLATKIDDAREQLALYLASTLQEYIDFIPERGNTWEKVRFTKATDYTFKHIDGNFFVFESDEEYREYGESITDVVELPFDFIDNPVAYIAKERAAKAETERKKAETNRVAAKARVANLRRQLEVAERSLGEVD